MHLKRVRKFSVLQCQLRANKLLQNVCRCGLTQRCVFCSLCRAADRHQRADQRSGQSRHPLPRLSHLCHEGSLPWHRWSPGAQRAWSKWHLVQERIAYIHLQLFYSESLTLGLLCTPNKMDFGSSASAVKLLWDEKVQENIKCSAVLWFICVRIFFIWLKKKVFCPLSETFHHDLIKIFFNPYYLFVRMLCMMWCWGSCIYIIIFCWGCFGLLSVFIFLSEPRVPF